MLAEILDGRAGGIAAADAGVAWGIGRGPDGTERGNRSPSNEASNGRIGSLPAARGSPVITISVEVFMSMTSISVDTWCDGRRARRSCITRRVGRSREVCM